MANIFRPSTWLRGKDRPEPNAQSRGPIRGHSGGIREAVTETQSPEGLSQPEDSSPSIHEQIEERAYYLWCEAGCPNGQDVDYWLAAERELLEESNKE